MSTQELIIEVNGVSRDTILNLVETHGNVTYCYTDDDGEEINVSLTHYSDPETSYEVEFNSGTMGTMMVHPELSSAIDEFFGIVEQNPTEVSSDSDAVEDTGSNED